MAGKGLKRLSRGWRGWVGAGKVQRNLKNVME